MPTRRHYPSGIVRDQADVSMSAILDNSVACENSTIDSGFLLDSIIKGKTRVSGNARIINSTLNCWRVAGNAIITNSNLGECVVARDDAYISNCNLLGTIKIEGDAALKGVDLIFVSEYNDDLRIHTGEWTRPPKFIEVGGFTISECVLPCVHLGCYRMDIEHILRIGEKFARRLGWDKDEEMQIRRFFEMLKEENNTIKSQESCVML